MMKLPAFNDRQYIKAEKVYSTDRLIEVLFLWCIPKTITPNHITLFRMIATPLTISLLITKNYEWGVPIFIIVALTDAIDGALARTRDKITQWGMLFDPLADKLLIIPSLLTLIFAHLSRPLVFSIIAIELFILILALIWKNQGRTVQANVWGKIKMILHVVGIVCLLLSAWLSLPLLTIASYILIASIFFAGMSIVRHGI
ncbi:CDP-alcohol phosphatidyltransferase family protein [Candidatus Uhrbacteria bacterium]|nr:CDP-alcohol phosphatidyltransferase family protein [Candidatus Uhrbacteria bacterium]